MRCRETVHNKSFKFVPALCASTGPKKAAPFWAALLKCYMPMKILKYLGSIILGLMAISGVLQLIFIVAAFAKATDESIAYVIGQAFSVFLVVVIASFGAVQLFASASGVSFKDD